LPFLVSASLSSQCCLAICAFARGFEEPAMLIEYIAGALVAAFVAVYLLYALIRPERF
jgi:K+-transporting ATPase KdpF subunit